jgi:aryl sulfotransferase
MPKLLRAPTREVRSGIIDSHRWDDFEPRDDDIIIGTFAKCGTTWTQRIVDMLVFQSPDIRPVGNISPWLDAMPFAPVEVDLATLKAQTHRRFIKSHLPFDALPLWEKVKYIHVGRDGRDARLSFHNHMSGFSPALQERVAAEARERALADPGAAQRGGPPGPPPADPREFFVQWLDEMESPAAKAPDADPPFFAFEATYWTERARPNLLLVHYNDLKEDLAGEIRRISHYLEIDTPESLLPELVEAARFETMKKQGDDLVPMLRVAFDRGADRFINQGRSGRWKEMLKPDDIARYEALARESATPALAAWIESGRLGAGDPRRSPD